MRKKEEGHHHHLIQQTVLPVMTAEAEAEENSRNLRKGKEQGAHHLLHPAQEADQDLSSPRTEERKVKKKKTPEERKKPYQLSLMLTCQNC